MRQKDLRRVQWRLKGVKLDKLGELCVTDYGHRPPKHILDTTTKSTWGKSRNKVDCVTRLVYREIAHQQCSYCFRKVPVAQIRVDHVIPRSAGGTDSDFNLVPVCRDCNDAKATQNLLHFLKLI